MPSNNLLSGVVKLQWTVRGRPAGRAIRLPAAKPGFRELKPPRGARGPLGIDLTVPIADITGIWTPYPERARLQKVEWRGKWCAAPYFRPAIVAFVDGDLGNRLLLATQPAEAEVTVEWALDQAAACYRVSVRWAALPPSLSFSLVCSTAAKPAAELVAKLPTLPRHARATRRNAHLFEPSFCTWYAYHGDIDQRAADRCADLAAELGFGAFIMDDGWQYDERQRVGANLGPWHRFTGDWVHSQSKFPDFEGHINRVREQGLRYILWFAPFMVGTSSRAFRRLRGHLLDSWLDEGYKAADPRSAEVRAHLRNTVARLVESYLIDGFKVDYDYGLFAPNEKHHGVGPAYARTVREMIRTAQSVRPDFEWNLMANGFTLANAQAFRCTDVPFDPETNRLTLVHLRALCGNAPLYYDPSLWSPQDSNVTVHRHMVPSLFCVPSVGAPIEQLPGTHLDIIRDWLAFYRRHQRLLNAGRFRALWAAGDYQALSTDYRTARVQAAFSEYPLALDAERETWLINATRSGGITVEASGCSRVFTEDPRGRRLGRERTIRKGLHRMACPAGRVLHFMFE